jgi:hypothetical protein
VRQSRGVARLCIRAALLAASLVLSVAGFAAEPLSDAERAQLQARKEALFQQMVRDPSNLDVTFAYADVAAKLGDDEAAVAALERMLLFNPNLPRVDLELGALYFRMGSFAVARSYFEKAAAASPPPEVKARVEQYLARIRVEEAPQRLVGYVQFGGQYQTDANVAPGSPLVQSPVGLIPLTREFVKQRDFDLFATAGMLYTYDLGTQDRDTFEVGATAFANHYLHFGRLDLDLAEINAGPRLRFPEPGLPLISAATVKPYAILNEVGLGEAQYFWTYGTGLETTAQLPQQIAAKAVFEFRQKRFTNAPDRPLSTGLDGSDKLFSLALSRPLGETSLLGLEFDYLNQDTRFDFYSNNSYAVAANYRLRYRGPEGTGPYPWETSFYITRSWAYYAAPDPCCSTSGNPFVFSPSNRYDRHWRFGVTQTFPVTDRVAVIAQLQRDIVSSNLSLYGYTTNSLLVGAQIRF